MNTGPRVLMVTPELPPRCGGIGWHVHYVSRELRRRGWHITLALRTSGNSKVRDGVVVFPAGRAPVLSAARLRRLLREFLRSCPHDLVVVHGTPLAVWGVGAPVVLVCHCCVAAITARSTPDWKDSAARLRRALLPLYRRVESSGARRADAVAVVSRAMGREIERYYGRKAAYVGNGIATERFCPARQRGVGVLYVGAIRHGKGLKDLVEMATWLWKERPDIRLTVVGGGPLLNRVRREVKRRALGNIRLEPPASHDILPAVYRRHGIFVLPSFYEGLPTAVLEAMSSGLPVVATDVGGTGEAVQHGITGLLHKPGDVEGMTKSLVALWDDQDLASRMGRAGREVVSERFSIEAVADRYERLMRKVLGEEGG